MLIICNYIYIYIKLLLRIIIREMIKSANLESVTFTINVKLEIYGIIIKNPNSKSVDISEIYI